MDSRFPPALKTDARIFNTVIHNSHYNHNFSYFQVQKKEKRRFSGTKYAPEEKNIPPAVRRFAFFQTYDTLITEQHQ